jgi:hypothetical protein
MLTTLNFCISDHDELVNYRADQISVITIFFSKSYTILQKCDPFYKRKNKCRSFSDGRVRFGGT